MLVDKLYALSLSHKRLSVDELSEISRNVHKTCYNVQAFVFHTCNRVEVYLYDADAGPAEHIKRSYGPYVEKVAEFRGVEAARHLFRVAAGLESMLIGETDVLGQLEEAYESQVRRGNLRGLLKTVVERAVAVGKRVRTETGISRGPRGLGSLSIVYLSRRLPLREISVCVIGAGAVGRGVVKELIDAGVRRVAVVNRTVEKAADLGVEVRPLTSENVEWCLREFDVVYTAVSSFEPVVVYVPPGSRVKLVVDLGVPRNTAPNLPVEVVTLDHLRELAEEFNRQRAEEVSKAEKIVEEEVARLEEVLRRRWVELEMSALLKKWFAVAEEEGERAGGGPARLAAMSTVKRTLLPLVNYIKEVAVKDLAVAEGLLQVLKSAYA
ncbi:glutamyl-tRNA reductase [Pyrobaculum calidifontis]|uniref:Glutamyl-tRNA reductase 1 n=1 Tax=Pyrobaculum calidifontis (strain DSM 21063 / JCM 11548 / VA1) TaxID=410359 RepID=HEM11_PYRCJ|nr:glutamyl-tRNA reductase [Pyrobaculum calidifontis]A3MW83.1 RecName: Full=Glutamyl-tRNA reductase 1; Short=GluTR 1 [Pyrobaculum calidifontis JCM 11548]ABO08900.1 glutamyl-tRNA reductase [Pyrobaculum calidifontis JCM 11548]